MSHTVNPSVVCHAPQGIPCIARELAEANRGLDHTDLLGYSGAAFRVQTLPREVLCPSTVSPRYGYQPPALEGAALSVAGTLQQARLLAQAGQFGEYLSGSSAYDLWIELLEADDQSDLMQVQTKAHVVDDAGLPILNKYCLLALLHAREAAGPFLRRRAAAGPGTGTGKVMAAADDYDQVVTVLQAIGTPSWEA